MRWTASETCQQMPDPLQRLRLMDAGARCRSDHVGRQFVRQTPRQVDVLGSAIPRIEGGRVSPETGMEVDRCEPSGGGMCVGVAKAGVEDDLLDIHREVDSPVNVRLDVAVQRVEVTRSHLLDQSVDAMEVDDAVGLEDRVRVAERGTRSRLGAEPDERRPESWGCSCLLYTSPSPRD